MQKNRFFHPAQTAPAMSPPHSYTIDDDGDDSDICPVCDGECTCHPPAHSAPRPQHPPPTPKPGVPLSMAELSLMYSAAGSASPTPPNSSSSGPLYPSSSTTTTTTTSTPAPSKPSLKIKLTVPPSLLAKRRQTQTQSHAVKSYKNPAETTSDYANAGYHSASNPPAPPAAVQPATAPAPKKRGRPPKSLASSRPNQQHTSTHYSTSRSPPYKPLNPKTAAPGKHPKSIKARPSHISSTIKSRPGSLPHARKKPIKKKRVLSSDDETSSLSSDSDVAMALAGTHALHRKNVNAAAPVADFPTFVAASALSSSLSSTNTSSSSSSLSEFDSDSDIEAEEENFILADVHDKARVKRELLGGGGEKRTGGRNNDWVIRTRKKSVGPSDVEMDVDSDATEDDDEDDEDDDEADADNDEADAEDDEETEEDVTLGASAAQMQMMQEDEGESTDDHRHRYVGLATGWSEEEDESSFDADLFFANLSDSDSISSKSSSGFTTTAGFNGISHNTFRHAKSPFAFSMGEEGDQSDISCAASDFTERGFGAGVGNNVQRRLKPFEALPFEVTQGWDGQIVFTNGVADTQNMVDLEFEADASRFADCTASSSATNSVYGDDLPHFASHGIHGDSDIEMEVDMHSEGGYEEEDGELEGSGDTTDEELVGEDDLPNERAMRLFSLPLSVSAINPLSTVSSPAVSPGQSRRRGVGRERSRRRRLMGLWGAGGEAGPGPSALDILQGRVVFYDSDEAVFDEESSSEEEEEESDEGEGDSDAEMEDGENADEDEDMMNLSNKSSELETMSEFEEGYDGAGYECDERMIKAMTNKLSRRMMKKGASSSSSHTAAAAATAGWDESLAAAPGTVSGGGKNIHIINKHNAQAKKLAVAAVAASVAAAAKNTNGSAKKKLSKGKAKGVDEMTGKISSGKVGGKRKTKSKKKKRAPTGPKQGVFSPSRETRQAVIGDDVKGADVPSPHPRFMGRRRAPRATTDAMGMGGVGGGSSDVGRFSVVEHLLRRHLHTLSASISSTGSIGDAPPPSASSASTAAAGVLANDPNNPSSPAATADERSPLELLFSSVAAVAAANAANPNMHEDVVLNGNVGANMGDVGGIQDAKPIQLDDVLEASFLDDPEDTQGASGSKPASADADASNNGAADSGTDTEAVSSSSFAAHDQQQQQSGQQQHQHQHQEENVHVHKNLARWDMISVGAFRQTRESGWGGMGMGMGMGGLHTPSSSADYGNVMKSSPFGAGRLGLGLGFGGLAGSSSSSIGGGAGGATRTRGSDKLAKRRRIMMGGSTMSSPLILPLGSGASAGVSASMPASPSPSGFSGSQLQQYHQQQYQQQQGQQQQQQQIQKSRKEQRRERKLMKKSSGYGAPHAPHHGQAFHVHHHHHPNAKARSASGSQRGNFFATSVPPLSL